MGECTSKRQEESHDTEQNAKLIKRQNSTDSSVNEVAKYFEQQAQKEIQNNLNATPEIVSNYEDSTDNEHKSTNNVTNDMNNTKSDIVNYEGSGNDINEYDYKNEGSIIKKLLNPNDSFNGNNVTSNVTDINDDDSSDAGNENETDLDRLMSVEVILTTITRIIMKYEPEICVSDIIMLILTKYKGFEVELLNILKSEYKMSKKMIRKYTDAGLTKKQTFGELFTVYNDNILNKGIYYICKLCEKNSDEQLVSLKIINKLLLTKNELNNIYNEINILRKLNIIDLHENGYLNDEYWFTDDSHFGNISSNNNGYYSNNKAKTRQSRSKRYSKVDPSLPSIYYDNYIIKLYNVFENNNKLYVINNRVTGCDILEYLLRKIEINESDIAGLFTKICIGVRYLHDKNIIHRKLIPNNIKFEKDTDDAKLCIVDFTLAVLLQDDQDNVKTSYNGNIEYMAPEYLSNKSYGTKIDIWSLGVILYVMLYGILPFKFNKFSNNKTELINNIINADYEFETNNDHNISDDAKDLLKHLLCINQYNRYDINQILVHKWMVNNNKTSFNKGYLNNLRRYKCINKLNNGINTLISIQNMADILHTKDTNTTL